MATIYVWPKDSDADFYVSDIPDFCEALTEFLEKYDLAWEEE